MQEKKLKKHLASSGQADEYLNGWKRALADYENLKKQVEKEKQEFVRFANLNLIMEFIPVYDNLKLALEHSLQNDWAKGIEHIKNQFQQVLEQNGVEEIMPKIGDEFSINEHEAVEEKRKEKPDCFESRSESGGKEIEESDKILEVINCGYKLNAKVIIPAKVVLGIK